jgi:hypothetical protein
MAREQVKQFRDPQGTRRCVAALRQLPRNPARAGLALFGYDTSGELIRDPVENATALADAARFLESSSGRERLRLFAALFPSLSSALEATWKLLHRTPYVQSFRAPNNATVSLAARFNLLRALLNLLKDYRADVVDAPWLATWAPYLASYSGANLFGYLLAAAVDGGGPQGETVFDLLRASAEGEHDGAGMGWHVLQALLAAARPDGWEFVEGLLLAADRQEGLRRSILFAALVAHPQAFRRLLRLVLDRDLLRFTSVLQGANAWTGIGGSVTERPRIEQALKRLDSFLNDEGARRQALDRGDSEAAFAALWCRAFEDADAALDEASWVIEDRKVERRFAAVTLLARLQHPGTAPLLRRAAADADLRVAIMALYGVRFQRNPGVEGIGWPEPDETWFPVLERLLARLPARATKLEPLNGQGHRVFAYRPQIASYLPLCLAGRPATVLIPYLRDLLSYGRGQLVRTLLSQGYHGADLRALFLVLLSDPDDQVRKAVLPELKKEPLAADDARRLEDLLRRRSPSLRQVAAELLASQPDDAALESCDQLLAGTLPQRLAGLELLRRLVEAGRRLADCRARAAAYEARHANLGGAEREYLDPLLHPDRKPPSLDDALGLMDPSGLTPVVPPRKRKVHFITPAAVGCLKALDELVHEHRETVVKIPVRAGVEERLLGSSNVPLWLPNGPGSVEEQLKRLPIYEVWEAWWHNRPARLRDRDGLELVRAALWCHFVESGNPNVEEELTPARQALLDALTAGQEPVALRYSHVVQTVVAWLLWLHPPIDPIEFYLDALESLYALAPVEWLLRMRNRAQLVGNGLLGRAYWTFQFWLEHADFQAATTPQRVRLWQILHWRDRPIPGAPRQPPDLDVLLDAFTGGAATADDVYEELLGPREPGQHSEGYFGGLQSATSERRTNRLADGPAVQTLVERCVQRVLDIELARAESPTVATRPALALQSVFGVDTVQRLLAALGRRSLRPAQPHAQRPNLSRDAVLTHLLSVALPGPDDTPAAFAARMQEGVKAGWFTQQRLLELAFLAPVWTAHVEHYLGWPGFAEGVWWFFAHMATGDQDMDNRLRTSEDETEQQPNRRYVSLWERLLRQRTALTAKEREEGAADVAWFQRVFAPLGPKHWEALASAAHLGENRRAANEARQLARVLLGTESRRALLAAVRKQKLRRAVCLLGLMPLPEGAAGEQDLVDRYTALQEYRRYGNTLRRCRPSALRAVEIGLENLAQTAGFPDPTRLEWAMEARAGADLAAGPLTASAQGVTVSLAVGAAGQPELTVRRGEQPLASVPARVRKDRGVAALLRRRTELRQQASRIRHSLEAAMCRADTFTGAELRELLRHPVLGPALASLVLVGDGVMGYPVRGGKGLRRPDGPVQTMKAADLLRIAHPYDLLHSDEWSLWQHDCFTAQRTQPFKQLFRELYLVTAQEKKDGSASHRYAGQQVIPAQAQALFNARAWDTRDEVSKTLRHAGLVVQVWFQHAGGTPLALEGWTFEAVAFRRRDSWEAVPLKEVPPLVFSEVMRDLDLVVSVAHLGGVDPEASASTVAMRSALVVETGALLGLANVRLKGRHVFIDGKLGNYTVHLGSGVVHRLPGGQVCIVPVYAEHRGRLFLPFADDDPRTAEVLAKVILLARDEQIQDPAILDQIRARPR